MDPQPPKRQCGACKNWKDGTEENFKKNRDGFAKVCRVCAENRAAARKATKATNPQNDGEVELEQEDVSLTGKLHKTLGNITQSAFLNALAASGDVDSLEAFVEMQSASLEGEREISDALASAISDQMKYRFLYQSHYKHKRTPSTRFIYNCAQNKKRQQKIKKSDTEGVQHRDKQQMETFDCHGWLHITVTEGSDVAFVRLSHEVSHTPYCTVGVPADIQEFVHANPDMSVTQLWIDILRKWYPKATPPFSRQNIYHLWHNNDKKKWQMHQDEYASAKVLLSDASQPGSHVDRYSVEEISLPQVEGFSAIAFSLPDVLKKWGGYIRELSLDSTWKTNGSNYEVYGVLGEISGSGCPLGYLFIKAPPESETGTKERFLCSLLVYLRDKWQITPLVTLTDKDMTEINACLSVFPAAKHQLCFWHCLRAVKTRLSILRRKPKFYSVDEAVSEFNWIDREFIPIGQEVKSSQKAGHYVASQAIPRVTVLLNGENFSQAPLTQPPAASQLRKLTLRMNGKIICASSIPEHLPVINEDDELDELDSDDDPIDLLEQVAQEAENDVDSEDGPAWMFDDNEEPLAANADYVFCPAPHRKALLQLFTKHFCQHEIFPERHGPSDDPKRPFSAGEIRVNAVFEMYNFCKVRGLREVWAYMWTSWYCPKMWRLWARSSSPYLSRLRTTMGVENFWRQLKHKYLHNLSHPRLDQVIYILINKVTPEYYARMGTFELGFRMGRSRPLTSNQKYLKKAWKALELRPINNTDYNVDISKWSCNCGHQKYNPHHLCKHLVQAVRTPLPPSFWTSLTRRRTRPLYQNKYLVPKDQEPDSDLGDHSGTITDGDDFEIPRSSSIPPTRPSQKRAAPEDQEIRPETSPVNVQSASDHHLERPHKRSRIQPMDAGDRTESSPAPDELIPNSEFEASDASVFDYGTDDEAKLDSHDESLRNKVKAMQYLCDAILEQLPHRNQTWMQNADKVISNDLVDFAKDLQRQDSGVGGRETTWARGRSKEERRRARNTMGYVNREPKL